MYTESNAYVKSIVNSTFARVVTELGTKVNSPLVVTLDGKGLKTTLSCQRAGFGGLVCVVEKDYETWKHQLVHQQTKHINSLNIQRADILYDYGVPTKGCNIWNLDIEGSPLHQIVGWNYDMLCELESIKNVVIPNLLSNPNVSFAPCGTLIVFTFVLRPSRISLIRRHKDPNVPLEDPLTVYNEIKALLEELVDESDCISLEPSGVDFDISVRTENDGILDFGSEWIAYTHPSEQKWSKMMTTFFRLSHKVCDKKHLPTVVTEDQRNRQTCLDYLVSNPKIFGLFNNELLNECELADMKEMFHQRDVYRFLVVVRLFQCLKTALQIVQLIWNMLAYDRPTIWFCMDSKASKSQSLQRFTDVIKVLKSHFLELADGNDPVDVAEKKAWINALPIIIEDFEENTPVPNNAVVTILGNIHQLKHITDYVERENRVCDWVQDEGDLLYGKFRDDHELSQRSGHYFKHVVAKPHLFKTITLYTATPLPIFADSNGQVTHYLDKAIYCDPVPNYTEFDKMNENGQILWECDTPNFRESSEEKEAVNFVLDKYLAFVKSQRTLGRHKCYQMLVNGVASDEARMDRMAKMFNDLCALKQRRDVVIVTYTGEDKIVRRGHHKVWNTLSEFYDDYEGEVNSILIVIADKMACRAICFGTRHGRIRVDSMWIIVTNKFTVSELQRLRLLGVFDDYKAQVQFFINGLKAKDILLNTYANNLKGIEAVVNAVNGTTMRRSLEKGDFSANGSLILTRGMASRLTTVVDDDDEELDATKATNKGKALVNEIKTETKFEFTGSDDSDVVEELKRNIYETDSEADIVVLTTRKVVSGYNFANIVESSTMQHESGNKFGKGLEHKFRRAMNDLLHKKDNVRHVWALNGTSEQLSKSFFDRLKWKDKNDIRAICFWDKFSNFHLNPADVPNKEKKDEVEVIEYNYNAEQILSMLKENPRRIFLEHSKNYRLVAKRIKSLSSLDNSETQSVEPSIFTRKRKATLEIDDTVREKRVSLGTRKVDEEKEAITRQMYQLLKDRNVNNPFQKKDIYVFIGNGISFVAWDHNPEFIDSSAYVQLKNSGKKEDAIVIHLKHMEDLGLVRREKKSKFYYFV